MYKSIFYYQKLIYIFLLFNLIINESKFNIYTLIQENFIIVNNYKREKYLEIVFVLCPRIINNRLQ